MEELPLRVEVFEVELLPLRVDVLPELLLLTADLVVEPVVVCWRVVDPAELCVRVEVLLEVELWLRLLMAGAFLLPELSR